MSHGTGRHRRRRQGLIHRVRWAVGAVLAVIIGAEPTTGVVTEVGQEVRSSPRKVPSSPGSVSHQGSTWGGRFDEETPSQGLQEARLHANSTRAEGRRSPVQLPEPGWCIDDDGVRAVRPYLVAHEQRQRILSRQAVGRVPHQDQRVAHVEPDGREVGGEWDELATLIRQWKAQQMTVA